VIKGKGEGGLLRASHEGGEPASSPPSSSEEITPSPSVPVRETNSHQLERRNGDRLILLAKEKKEGSSDRGRNRARKKKGKKRSIPSSKKKTRGRGLSLVAAHRGARREKKRKNRQGRPGVNRFAAGATAEAASRPGRGGGGAPACPGGEDEEATFPREILTTERQEFDMAFGKGPSRTVRPHSERDTKRKKKRGRSHLPIEFSGKGPASERPRPAKRILSPQKGAFGPVEEEKGEEKGEEGEGNSLGDLVGESRLVSSSNDVVKREEAVARHIDHSGKRRKRIGHLRSPTRGRQPGAGDEGKRLHRERRSRARGKEDTNAANGDGPEAFLL